MANRYRGEIEAEIGGATRRLRLTLGALADLESAFGADDMADLARRFSSGTLRARDAVRVIAAGIRGGGTPVTDEEVAAMAAPGGAAGYAAIVVRLIAATFGGEVQEDRAATFGGEVQEDRAATFGGEVREDRAATFGGDEPAEAPPDGEARPPDPFPGRR